VAESPQITALRKKIAEAEEAYHQVMLGDKATEVTFGVNRGTKWTPANSKELVAYIDRLKGQLATLLGTGSRTRGPIYPTGDAR
jgi:hypothetical protein